MKVVVIAYFSDGLPDPIAIAGIALLYIAVLCIAVLFFSKIHFWDGNVDGSFHINGGAEFERRCPNQFLQLQDP